MTDTLRESLADIEALAHRVTWELMDEAQRDEFMRKIVVPRWGMTTSDGVLLKGTAWARLTGADANVIRVRYQRLNRRSEAQSERTISGPTEGHRGVIRGARSTIRKHPEMVKELLADPAVQEILTDAVASDTGAATAVDRKRDEATPLATSRETKPRDYDRMVDKAANDITVALSAETSGKWTPTPQSEALLYFLARQIADRQLPADLATDDITKIEEYANRGTL